jgi:hypothetical protein
MTAVPLSAPKSTEVSRGTLIMLAMGFCALAARSSSALRGRRGPMMTERMMRGRIGGESVMG